ncbi:hypothetical protein OJ997_00625 [Solirubrobacter phytolaccae]|uniref:Uncharacterized protein n=1 Tax=Solirubrobacter phytolaccae TaxID=1404360 RepID=A0A9X3N9V7_9ACTN|nr:hypothetical protein [Solirubrobacter phytolaccae]MDA0178782.1 hypothetical protein [Solirubrobacter phytolaccae]
MTTPSNTSGLERLIADLKTPAVRVHLARGIANLAAGDWPALLRWGAAQGYELTYDELLDAFKRSPRLEGMLAATHGLGGWEPASLRAAAGNAG